MSVTSFKVGTLELVGTRYAVHQETLLALTAAATYQEVMRDRPGIDPVFVRKQIQPKSVSLTVSLTRSAISDRRMDYETLVSAMRPTDDTALVSLRWVEDGVTRKIGFAALEIAPGPWYASVAGSLMVPNAVAQVSYPGLVLATQGLVAYYRLGEQSGAVMNDVLGGYDGSYVGAPTLAATGALAGDTDDAVTFNGTDEYAKSTATIPGMTEMTLECWFKTTSALAAQQAIVAHAHTVTNAYNASIAKASATPTKVTVYVWNAPTNANMLASATSTKVVNDGLWHHVAAVIRKGRGISLYVDGILDTQTIDLLSTWVPGAAYASVGAYAIASAFFPGSVDEFAIYNRGLTSAEVAQHYAAGITAL